MELTVACISYVALVARRLYYIIDYVSAYAYADAVFIGFATTEKPYIQFKKK